MTLNQKLTHLIKGRTIQDLQMNPSEVSLRFSDGSTMQVKVMESNSPPLKNGAKLSGIYEQSTSLRILCEDERCARQNQEKRRALGGLCRRFLKRS
jgi:hypothetical protein